MIYANSRMGALRPLGMARWVFGIALSLALASPNGAFAADAPAAMNAAPAHHGELGAQLSVATVLPFVILLGCIAVLPLFAGHWWEKNKNKGIVAALLALPLAVYLLLFCGVEGQHALQHAGQEYVSFILLLASLFVISGGIYIQGSLSGTPLVNTAIIAIGVLLASVIGTTGASVLLIRPLLRANAKRRNVVHIVVFFIFAVSNCGGLLTPLGDPPLFLGFLKGVPFTWTFILWPQWLFANGILLVVFNVWDQIALNREERNRPGSQLEEVQIHEPLRISGSINVFFLAGVVAVIASSGSGLGNHGQAWPFGVQELCMACLTLASYFLTPTEYHAKNGFTFGPIIEVALLFAGIFVTMSPALMILNSWGQGHRDVFGVAFGMTQPWQFFWASGVLSGVLDNAPTYLTFASTACGLKGVGTEGRYLADFLAQGTEAAKLLAAISCGSVFMGANTYIGNGPNFMVKAIAEENGVKMPSFFGYMLYSGCILIPIFVIMTFIFFR